MAAREAALERWYPWFGWYQQQLGPDASLERINMRDAYVAGFVAGGAHALKTSAHLAGLVQRLDLLNELLAAELDAQASQAQAAQTGR